MFEFIDGSIILAVLQSIGRLGRGRTVVYIIGRRAWVKIQVGR